MPTELSQRIQSRCYWQAVIRPEQFQHSRIRNYSQLLPIVRQSAVSLRGWDFPHVDDRRESRRTGDDWVGEELDWRDHLELWRLYQSGQFVSLRGLWHDWQGTDPVIVFPLWDTIFRFTEIYEFAARLALTDAGDASMRVEVKIGNLQDRILFQDNPGKSSIRRREFAGRTFVHPAPDSPPIPREELVAAPRELAAEALTELFGRFDFNATAKVVRSWQDEVIMR